MKGNPVLKLIVERLNEKLSELTSEIKLVSKTLPGEKSKSKINKPLFKFDRNRNEGEYCFCSLYGNLFKVKSPNGELIECVN